MSESRCLGRACAPKCLRRRQGLESCRCGNYSNSTVFRRGADASTRRDSALGPTRALCQALLSNSVHAVRKHFHSVSENLDSFIFAHTQNSERHVRFLIRVLQSAYNSFLDWSQRQEANQEKTFLYLVLFEFRSNTPSLIVRQRVSILLKKRIDARNAAIPTVFQILESQTPFNKSIISPPKSLLSSPKPILRVRFLSFQRVLGPHSLRINKLAFPRLKIPKTYTVTNEANTINYSTDLYKLGIN